MDTSVLGVGGLADSTFSNVSESALQHERDPDWSGGTVTPQLRPRMASDPQAEQHRSSSAMHLDRQRRASDTADRPRRPSDLTIPSREFKLSKRAKQHRKRFRDRQLVRVGLYAIPAVVVILVAIGILHAEDALTLLWLGSLVNVVMSLLKAVLAQFTVHRKALMADALHGLGDTAAQVVAALAYSHSSKPPDKEYPWGYGKIESMGTLLVAAILLYAAASIGWDSAQSLYENYSEWRSRGNEDPLSPADTASPTSPWKGKDPMQVPSSSGVSEEPLSPWKAYAGETNASHWVPVLVAVASIALKEALFQATLSVGTAAESRLAVATAWQHRSDSLSAGVALVSQLGASYGHHYLDAVGGSVVASLLAGNAWDSLKDGLDDLLDYNLASANSDPDSPSRCGAESLGASITSVPGVRNHTLRTRRMGAYCLADVTIVVDSRISASAASMIAEAVHLQLVNDHQPFVSDVHVHVDPEGTPQFHRLDGEDPMSHNTTQSISRQFHPSSGGTPEIVEQQVRDALRSLATARPDLPQILDITELQTYYSESGDSEPESGFVDVKVDIRLPLENTSLRDAHRVARAARKQVKDALPGVVREVAVALELDENFEE